MSRRRSDRHKGHDTRTRFLYEEGRLFGGRL
jgi:hypothetical protein